MGSPIYVTDKTGGAEQQFDFNHEKCICLRSNPKLVWGLDENPRLMQNRKIYEFAIILVYWDDERRLTFHTNMPCSSKSCGNSVSGNLYFAYILIIILSSIRFILAFFDILIRNLNF